KGRVRWRPGWTSMRPGNSTSAETPETEKQEVGSVWFLLLHATRPPCSPPLVRGDEEPTFSRREASGPPSLPRRGLGGGYVAGTLVRIKLMQHQRQSADCIEVVEGVT